MIKVVLGKELRDHWRDRRSVLGVMVLPMMGPLLLVLTLSLLSQRTRDRPLEVPIQGAENAPQLVTFLGAIGATIEEPPADPEQAVLDHEVPLVLKIGDDFASAVRASRPAPLEILVDESNSKAARDVIMLERAIAAYGEQLTAQRLIVRGVTPSVAKPVKLRQRNVARPERAAARILGMIPMLLVLVAFIGGMNIAIDTTAGERERRSLEPLLLNPARRIHLLMGKWLATSIFGVGVLLVAVTAFVITLQFTNTDELGIEIVFGAKQATQAFATLLPLAVLAAAFQMLVATFARTFKEAQTYLSLITLLPIAPALYLMLNPGTAETWMMFVPAMGQVACITDVLGGDPLSWQNLGLMWASSAVYCAAVLGILSKLLDRESIVFGR